VLGLPEPFEKRAGNLQPERLRESSRWSKRSDVLGIILRQGMKLALAGIVIGLLGAFILMQALPVREASTNQIPKLASLTEDHLKIILI